MSHEEVDRGISCIRNTEIDDYILGQLPEDKQEEIEERMLSDKGLLDEILARKQEIIDDYLDGKMSSDEEAIIEQRRRENPSFNNDVENAKAIKDHKQP